MRAIRYDACGEAEEVLRLVDLPDPRPGANEVLVRICASGVNPHDTKKRSGWLPHEFDDQGVVPHSDGAGEIIEVGAAVDASWVGQRVFFCGAPAGRGTAAEYCVVPAHRVFPLPDDLTFEQGASLGVPAFTAWLCVLEHGRPLAGKTVLVHGGSGCVGRVVVEIAALNFANVIATAGSDERAAIAAQRGAASVVSYKSDDLAGELMELTGGKGVDIVVDVDFSLNLETNIRVIRDHGLICSYSSTSNPNPVLPYYGLALKGASINFVQGAKLDGANLAAAGGMIGALLENGKITPDVSDVHSLPDCARAHNLVESAQASGNVVVAP